MSCERLVLPPRPTGVPEGSQLDRRNHVWILRGKNQEQAWYENGIPAWEGQLDNGRREGRWRWFATDGLTVATEGTYRNGQRDGIWIHRDEAGNLYVKIRYAREPVDPVLIALGSDVGNENGPFERYYPDGKIELSGAYRAGRFNGTFVRYFQNGRVEYEGSYREGLKEGHWLIHRPDGSLLRDENYRDGEVDGPFQIFDTKGRPAYSAVYARGVKKSETVLAKTNREL